MLSDEVLEAGNAVLEEVERIVYEVGPSWKKSNPQQLSDLVEFIISVENKMLNQYLETRQPEILSQLSRTKKLSAFLREKIQV